MNHRYLWLLFGLALVARVVTAQAAEPVRVVTSIPVLACFAMNVGGDRVAVRCLLPPSASPHDFALSPGDLKRVGEADLLVTQGLGLDEWIERPLRRGGLGSGARHVRASDGVPVLASSEPMNAGAGHDHSHAHSDGQGEPPNPHTWLDPVRAIRAVENIRDALIAENPSGQAEYERRAASYAERLRSLDKEIREATLGIKRRDLVTSHDAFPYFAERFGFRIAGVFELFPGREATPKEIRALRQVISGGSIGGLVAEPGASPRLLESMAADLGLPVIVVDPLDMGTPAVGFYETGMRENLKSLLAGLHGR